MGLLTGPTFVLTVCLCLKYGFAYMEALAANADASGLSIFEPEVAFICRKPAMHRVVNGWEADNNTDCLEEPEDILEYCKKIYPDHDIKNVVEPSNKRVEIPNWPKFEGYEGPEPKRTQNHKVKTYKCLVTDFESEALLVPQHCVFDHEHDADLCARPRNWTRTAADKCGGRGMVLESSGMLVVCGVDAFRGVEYVCCPNEPRMTPRPSIPEDSSEEGDYSRYLRGEDMPKYDNEHKEFKAAEKDMQRKQQDKVKKMMKQWTEARAKVASMQQSEDEQQQTAAEQLNKDITERFQRMYTAYVEEGKSEKKQLIALHQQRVQALFNKRKRMLMNAYKDELESQHPKSSRILSYLQQYIRTEEKDRLHTVNHFEHVRDQLRDTAEDVAEVKKIRETTVTHLQLIDQRIEEAIDMLHRDLDLEKKIRPVIADFRHKKFRTLELSESDVVQPMVGDVVQPVKIDVDVETIPIYGQPESEDMDSEEEEDYTQIRLDSDEGLVVEDMKNIPYQANAQSNGAAVEVNSFTNSGAGVATYNAANVVGIAIGSVSVFVIIVVAVVMLRKRSQRQPITHGFVEVDPAASPEERHVANMQMNGYENPTYRYFEMAN